uniref:DNA polymerase n=1 Tax=Sulfophobococcus zilligii TaxID=53426 RepID=Q29Y55_SULZI|nr:DNA polymerase [Sulfophobococcus zilligii]
MSEIEFYLLDVTYEVVGGEPHIIMYGVSRDGRRIVLRDKSFRPYFYAIISDDVDPTLLVSKIKALSEPNSPITSVEQVYKKYYGRPVKALKITTVIPEYVRRYRDKVKSIRGVEEVVEADIRFSMRYILDKELRPCGWHIVRVRESPSTKSFRVDSEYEVVGEIRSLEDSTPPRDLRLMAVDIEVYSEHGSPKPSRDPVIIIGVGVPGGGVKQFTASGLDDRNAIAEFVDYVLKYDPDIILGYNSNSFDWPYLLERTRVLGIRFDIGRRIGALPTTSTYGHISIPGRLSVDLYNYAEEISEIKLKSLDVVAEYLGVMKRNERVLIDYTEFPKYWRDPEKKKLLLKYNEDDVVSTLGLADKFLPFAMQLSYITRIPLDQVGAASVGFRLEWVLMYEAYKRNELIPNREEREVETYKGAVVFKPVPGIHEDIAVLDFTSMYPSIMIKYNVGPDTLVGELCEGEGYNIAPEVGHCFRAEPPGFFKDVLVKLLQLRKSIREEMKKYPPTSYEYRLLDERQRAVKILANATYGYMGWTGARWYCKACAEAVTAWGRQLIRKAVDLASNLGLKVIYGDTDSLFVTYNPEKIKIFIELVERELGFEIKVDKVYKRVFFTEAKKRYAGLLEDGRIDIVGFEAVRGDWAEVAKEVQENIVEILLKEGSVDKAVEYVRTVISNLMQGKIPLEKLIIWKTLTKPLEEYEATAPHVKAARRLINQGFKVEVGDKIGYVVLKGTGSISDRAYPYILVKDPKTIDYNYYIDHQIIPATLRILEYFGVSETQLKRASTGRKGLFEYLGKKQS